MAAVLPVTQALDELSQVCTEAATVRVAFLSKKNPNKQERLALFHKRKVVFEQRLARATDSVWVYLRRHDALEESKTELDSIKGNVLQILSAHCSPTSIVVPRPGTCDEQVRNDAVCALEACAWETIKPLMLDVMKSVDSLAELCRRLELAVQAEADAATALRAKQINDAMDETLRVADSPADLAAVVVALLGLQAELTAPSPEPCRVATAYDMIRVSFGATDQDTFRTALVGDGRLSAKVQELLLKLLDEYPAIGAAGNGPGRITDSSLLIGFRALIADIIAHLEPCAGRIPVDREAVERAAAEYKEIKFLICERYGAVADVGQTIRDFCSRNHLTPTPTLPVLLRLMQQEWGTGSAQLPGPAQKAGDDSTFALLRVYTNGLANDRICKATQVAADDELTVNERLTEIDALMPIPATASAEHLGAMLGKTKQAVLKSEWWKQNRQGEKENEIARRRAVHKARAKTYEAPAPDQDDDWR